MNNNTELLELQDRYNRICNELKQTPDDFLNKIRNEEGEATTDTTEIQRIIRDY